MPNQMNPLQSWLYSTSFGLLLLILLSLATVMPIDIIVQSKTHNSHLATNTIIVFSGCAVFVVWSFAVQVFRSWFDKKHLRELPRGYLPITQDDIGYKTSNYIRHQLEMGSQVCEENKKNLPSKQQPQNSATILNEIGRQLQLQRAEKRLVDYYTKLRFRFEEPSKQEIERLATLAVECGLFSASTAQ
ncbi:Dlt1 protein [Martiniozyma asiatica (nom. inval.)]|nr:Dlt1 protein [Martiniozyma asiatica]